MQIDNSNSGPFSLSFEADFRTGCEQDIVTYKEAIIMLPAEVLVLAKDCAAEKKRKAD